VGELRRANALPAEQVAQRELAAHGGRRRPRRGRFRARRAIGQVELWVGGGLLAGVARRRLGALLRDDRKGGEGEQADGQRRAEGRADAHMVWGRDSLCYAPERRSAIRARG